MTTSVNQIFAHIPVVYFEIGGKRITGKATQELLLYFDQVFNRIGGTMPVDLTPQPEDVYPPALMTDQDSESVGTEVDLAALLQQMVDTAIAGETGMQPQEFAGEAPEMLFPPLADPATEGLEPSSMAVTSSPMSYRAERRCAVHVDGAITAASFSRGAFSGALNNTQVIYELNRGDALTITYAVAPTITLIPR